MPNKTEEYLALACKTADSFSRQWEHWAEFLITAARLYKYSYPDQLMIYAQRPDATACAEYDVWNNKMNRYVRRGSKGIALLDESGGYPRLHYVFDVSDTAPRRNALYPDLWQINDSLKEPVRSMLAENYGVHSESFGQQLADVAGKLVQSYWDNNSSDILGIVDGSYLMSYDQKIFLRWNQVEKYIDLMMQADRYLTDKEKSAIELYFELNADSAAEYNALKEQYPDALVGFEQNGQFEFYGEDVRKICELTGGKLLERETALGTVLVTGFPREQWMYRAKQLWECGENIYLAGLNEDGTHHQTKYLRREDYLPVGSIVHMEGRKFRVDKVDFDKDSVTLQDMALAELRMPIFREAPLAVVRELYEQEPEPPVLGSDGLGLPGEDSNKLPVSIEANEVPTTPEAAAAEEGLNEEGAPELAGNFRITDEELGAGGPKQKFARNIKAIKTLFTLEQEHRGATAEEQQVLSQYVGWGGLADAFDPDKSSWAKEYAELKGLLSEEEYKAARGSVLNAHYTSPTVIRAIYDAVERMGFRTGNILEPSMGVGNFFGMLPESMADSRLYGVELDSITGRIAQKLYPEANIKVAGFETTDRRDFYDLVVGNVPFGNYKVNDKAYNKLNFSIHNYFFAKAIDQVRPGGIVAFVTSRYTLDSKDSAARKHIAERADLLGAIRLPNNAFRANAGTDVVSDIIFLQKRDRPMDHEPAWVQLGKTADGIAINSYFADHPEMILGELTTESTQYGKEEATVVPIEGANLADQLRETVQQLEGQYLEAAAEVPDIAETEAERRTLPADPDVKNFSYPQGAGSAHRDRGEAGERTD